MSIIPWESSYVLDPPMDITKVNCPHCQAILKSAKAIPVGKKVTCLKCGQPFTVQAEGNPTEQLHASAIQASATLAPGNASTIAAPNGLPNEPLPSSLASPSLQKSAGHRGILILLSVLGIMLLLGGGASLYLLLMSGNEPAPKLVENDVPGEEPTYSFVSPRVEKKEKKEPPKVVAKVPEKKDPPKEPPKVKPKPPEPVKPLPPEDNTPLFSAGVNVSPGVTPRRVEQAIQKGIGFLKSKQLDTGSWLAGKGKHTVGYAALPGLTLLECKVPTTDPVIAKAAAFVRANSDKLKDTYDLGLAILFLDRLGEKEDQGLIQTLALRLVAGQTSAGGWDYDCQVLTPEENQALLKFLQTNKPGQAPAKGSVEGLPEKLQKLSVVLNQGKEKGKNLLRDGRDDNSNTQFAMLGLWAARRHGVPTEHTLLLSHQRFEISQNKDGGWSYTFKGGTKDTMTCVGLLGLALGHGAEAAQEPKKKVKDNKVSAEDPAIQKGLRALGKFIGLPSETTTPPMDNLYFLWSVERVAMLYNLKTIGTRDWYAWGAQILLAHQQEPGNWSSNKYHGSTAVIDTCFAMLFLRRSNLVQDLTENLGLILAITDPDAGPRKK